MQQLLIDNLTGRIIDNLEVLGGLIQAESELIAVGPDHVHYERSQIGGEQITGLQGFEKNLWVGSARFNRETAR